VSAVQVSPVWPASAGNPVRAAAGLRARGEPRRSARTAARIAHSWPMPIGGDRCD